MEVHGRGGRSFNGKVSHAGGSNKTHPLALSACTGEPLDYTDPLHHNRRFKKPGEGL